MTVPNKRDNINLSRLSDNPFELDVIIKEKSPYSMNGGRTDLCSFGCSVNCSQQGCSGGCRTNGCATGSCRATECGSNCNC